MKNAATKIDSDQLKQYDMLNRLSADDARELLSTSLTNSLSAGTPIFNKGDTSKQLFFLLEGEVELVTENRGTRIIQSGTAAGHHPLGAHLPGQLAARAASDCLLLSFDADMLDLFLNWSATGGYQVDEVETDKDHAWVNHLLSSRGLLRFSEQHIEQLLSRMHALNFRAGDVVIQQDGLDDKYYIVKSGSCEVSRTPEAGMGPIKLANLKQGDAFGEEALLAETPRTATVTMKEAGTLMALSKEDFSELLATPFLNTVNWDECQSLFDTGTAVLIDVRNTEEFNMHHLPGSINMPLPILRLKLKQLDEGRKYILICADGSQSSVAAFLLNRNGYDAFILDGGLLAAKHAPEFGAAGKQTRNSIDQKSDTQGEQRDMASDDTDKTGKQKKGYSYAEHWGDLIDGHAHTDAPSTSAAPKPQQAAKPNSATKKKTPSGNFIPSAPRKREGDVDNGPKKHASNKSAFPVKTLIAVAVLVVAIPMFSSDTRESIMGLLSSNTAAPVQTPVENAPSPAAQPTPPAASESPVIYESTPANTAAALESARLAPPPPAVNQSRPEPVLGATVDPMDEMIGAPIYEETIIYEQPPAAQETLDPAMRGISQP